MLHNRKLPTITAEKIAETPAPQPAMERDFKEQVVSRGICDGCHSRRAEIPLGTEKAYCRRCYIAYAAS